MSYLSKPIIRCLALICYSDYATWTNLQMGIDSNAMSCDYKMVNTLEGAHP